MICTVSECLAVVLRVRDIAVSACLAVVLRVHILAVGGMRRLWCVCVYAGALVRHPALGAALALLALRPRAAVRPAAWQGPPCDLWQGPPEDLWQGPVLIRAPPASPELALGPAAAVVWGLGGLAAALARR